MEAGDGSKVSGTEASKICETFKINESKL